MTELSPAAQAVMDAFMKAPCDNELSIAAALRAVADRVTPEHKPWLRTGGEPAARHKVRLELLAIAAEMEAGQ